MNQKMAHFAGLAYGDGYPGRAEIRVVTALPDFADKLLGLTQDLADVYKATCRVNVRPGNISDNPQYTITLTSTLLRRALFDDSLLPRYDAIHAIAMEQDLAADFQGGLSDAEGSLHLPEEIECPHGRIFAAVNSDRRLLGIARLALVYKLRLEPGSVSTRLSSKRGRIHTLRGHEIVTRKNSYLIEILAGAKKKWLTSVGRLLWHPEKQRRAKILLATFGSG